MVKVVEQEREAFGLQVLTASISQEVIKFQGILYDANLKETMYQPDPFVFVHLSSGICSCNDWITLIYL